MSGHEVPKLESGAVLTPADGALSSKAEAAAWFAPPDGADAAKQEAAAWFAPPDGADAAKIEMALWLTLRSSSSCCEDPVVVDPDVVALLSQRALRVAYLVELDFLSTPQYLWNGHYPLTVGGHTWSGLRHLGGIEGLEDAADMTAQQMKFTLSGVDAATLALAVGEDRDEYVGRIVTVWMQFFDAGWQPVGDPIARACGIMDGLEITRSRDGDKDKQNTVRVLTLTAENIFYGRGVPPASNYTDRDQKFRSVGDRGLEFVSEVQNTVIQVPW